MNHWRGEPDWLQTIACYPGEGRVQRWENVNDRQFVVLPSYANGVAEPGKEIFMLWARALSNGQLYPVPHGWYGMDLLHDRSMHYPSSQRGYRWVCYGEDQGGSVRMELNMASVVIDDSAHSARITVSPDYDSIAPEPVQRSLGTAERPATVFYPDSSLWSNLPRLHNDDLSFDMEPLSLEHATHPGIYGPVETYWGGRQEIRIRGASTALWNRKDAARPEDEYCQ